MALKVSSYEPKMAARIAKKQGLLEKNQNEELEFCEHFVLGKDERPRFTSATHRTKGNLDYTHSDLLGSLQKPLSLSNCQYFISFIDDYSRKAWIYFLKNKS